MRDVHNDFDERSIEIKNIGICDKKMPFIFVNENNKYHVVADVKTSVILDKNQRGAHLSRIVEVLNEQLLHCEITVTSIKDILVEMCARCESDAALLQLEFEIFNEILTPVSRRKAIETIGIKVYIEGNVEEIRNFNLGISLYGMLVCPCSKEISSFGAHTQKCKANIEFKNITTELPIIDVVQSIKKQFSAPIFDLLKREDEKYITELSYQNTKFSEDLVKDCLKCLKDIYKTGSIRIEVINYESIHQHNVYAVGEIG